MCVCVYFKELGYVIMEAGKFQIFRVDQQAGDQGSMDIAVQV